MTLAQKLEMYSNLSTAPSFIRIKVRDAESGRVMNIILENTDFSDFFYFAQVAKEEYVDFMVRNADEPLDVDLTKLEAYLASVRSGSKRRAKEYLQSRSYEDPMTLQKLGLRNEDELIAKYFLTDERTGTIQPKPGFPEVYEASFFGMLLELGYVITRGDYLPI